MKKLLPPILAPAHLFRTFRFPCLFLGCVVLFLPGVLPAQEAVRMSMTSAQAAEARRRANATVGYYNLKLGPTLWRFAAELGMEYNSNVRYTEDAEGDFILRPGFDTNMRLPVTELNSLTLDLRTGYSFYTSETDLSRWYIYPGSAINFDMFIGDLAINVHDRFTIEQNSYQDPTFTGGDFSQLENAVGVSAIWDANELQLRGGYDHVTFTKISGEAVRPDGSQEVFYIQGGAQLQPGSFTGLEMGAGLVDYDEDAITGRYISDGFQWNAGIFHESPISEYISFMGSVGYTVWDPDNQGSTNSYSEDFSGLYARLAFRHRLNQYLDYTLSGGRQISFSFYGGATDLWNVRWSGNWRVIEKVGLSTFVEYSRGEELYTFGETFDQIGGGVGISRGITQKLSAGLNYYIYSRSSDVENRDYVVNSVGLSLRYAF